jgi:hypothetical protein
MFFFTRLNHDHNAIPDPEEATKAAEEVPIVAIKVPDPALEH